MAILIPGFQLKIGLRLRETSGASKCEKSVAEAESFWHGKLISGQWWRSYTTFPDELQNRKDFTSRFCLPDHDFVAVDSATPKNEHLYDTNKYKRQYELRRA